MDAFSAVMDKVKSHPEMMEKVSAVMDKVKKSHPEAVEKVKDEVMSLADALHLRRHGKLNMHCFWGLHRWILFIRSLIVKHLPHPYLQQDPKIKNLSLKRRPKKARQRRASKRRRVPLLTRLQNLMCWSRPYRRFRLSPQLCSRQHLKLKLKFQLRLLLLLLKLRLKETSLKTQTGRWRKMTQRSGSISPGSSPCCLRGSAPRPTRRKTE